jgi:hypothetical protein
MSKLRDTVKNRITKIEMLISDIKRIEEIAESINEYMDGDMQSDYGIVIEKLKEEINKLEKLNPKTELDKFAIAPAIINRLNNYYKNMSKKEKQYLRFLDSKKEKLKNGVIYYDNDFYQHRVVPCRFEPFENCRKIEYKSINIVRIDNDDYDCLVIDYSGDNDWDNPRSCY